MSSEDSTKSPLKLNLSSSDGDDINPTATSRDNVFESPMQQSPEKITSPKVNEAELKKQIMSDIQEKSMSDLPKVVLNKTVASLELSPGNKENEKSNCILENKNLKFLTSNIIPTHRKSAVFLQSKKIDIAAKLNRSVDDKMLANIEQQFKTILPESDKSNISMATENNLLSTSNEHKNESIICLDDAENKTAANDDTNEKESLTNVIVLDENKLTSTNIVDNECITTSASVFIPLNEDIDNKPDAMINERKSIGISPTVCPLADSSLTQETEIQKDNEEIINDNKDVKRRSSLKKRRTLDYEQSSETIEDNAQEMEVQQDSMEIINDNKDVKRRSSLKKRESLNREPMLSIEDNKPLVKTSGDETVKEIENLFHDISAEEWKNNDPRLTVEDQVDAVNDQVSQVEQEEDYDLILVDKEAWEASEKDRSLKIQDASDYDSDDTIILHRLKQLSKSTEPQCESTVAVEPMDVDEDDVVDEQVVEQEKPLNKSRKSSMAMGSKNTEINDEHEAIEEVVVADTLNVSKRKSLSKNSSFSASNQAIEDVEKAPTVADRKSLNSEKLPTPKRRSFINMGNFFSKSLDSPDKSTSINPSAMDIAEDENNIQEEIQTPAKSPMNRSRQSLNKSGRKTNKTPTTPLLDEDNEESSTDKINNHSGSSKKSKTRNISTIVQINSDSDSDQISSQNSNENNESRILPAFLYNANTSSDNTDDEAASIDSDIAQEYNLDGESNVEYSDDDIIADDCRASETETSDSDDDDDDMADFINDDDDEEEVSDEDNDDDDDEEKDNHLEDIDEEIENPQISVDEISDEELNVSVTKNIVSPKKLSFDTSDEFPINTKNKKTKNDQENELNKSSSSSRLSGKHQVSANKSSNISILIEEPTPQPKKTRKSLNKKPDNLTSLDSSTPKHLRRSLELASANKSLNDKNTSVLNESGKKKKSKKSISEHDASITADNSIQVLNTSVNEGQNIININTDKSNVSLSKATKASPLNKTMITQQTNSPDTQSLMKEKLNDSLPALKLQRRSLKATRKSLLENVVESEAQNNEKILEITAPENTVNDSVNESMNKKKKKKKKHAGDNNDETIEILETTIQPEITVIEQQPEIVDIEQQVVEKKKKKNKNKNKSDDNAITTIVPAEPEEPKLNKNMKKKQKNKIIEEITNPAIVEEPKKKKNARKVDVLDSDVSTVSSKKSRTQKSPIVLSESNIENVPKIKQKKIKGMANKIAVTPVQPNIKRLSEDILENLSDVPIRPNKRRKLNQKFVPSTTMFDSEHVKPANLTIEDTGYISLSSSGGTTQFSVVNLQKTALKRPKQSSAASAFRERILARNPRQPVSAYLMYQQKLKASGRNKF